MNSYRIIYMSRPGGFPFCSFSIRDAKIARMQRNDQLQGSTHRKNSGVRFTFLILVVIASLLAPTLLCAMPAAPMNATEHQCCEHMAAKECSEANLSAC